MAQSRRSQHITAAQIRRCIERDLTVAQAAEQLGISPQALRRLNRKYGLSFPPKQARSPRRRAHHAVFERLGTTAEAAIRSGIDEGLTSEAIAQRYGVSVYFVWSEAKRCGIRWPKHSPATRPATLSTTAAGSGAPLSLHATWGLARTRFYGAFTTGRPSAGLSPPGTSSLSTPN